MTEADWRASYAKSVAVFLNGSAITEPDPRGDRVTDKKFLLLFNAGDEPITFTIPEALGGAGGSATDWEIVIDTDEPARRAAGRDRLPAQDQGRGGQPRDRRAPLPHLAPAALGVLARALCASCCYLNRSGAREAREYVCRRCTLPPPGVRSNVSGSD